MTKDYGYYNSPIGWIEVVANEKLISLAFVEEANCQLVSDNIVVRNCIEQLQQYFTQDLQTFDLPLAIKGTDFQKLVWQATLTIPYGTSLTYQQLAEKINHPKSIRAVGSALKRNPLAIIVPCHRVVSNNGTSINYYFGPARKIFLQELEEKRVR